jgi:SAM-dependent methyltransferase
MRKVIQKLKEKVYKLIYPHAGPFYCPVCDTQHVAMNPLSPGFFEQLQKNGYVHNIFSVETLNIAHYSCAKCEASDRDRLYALYLKNYLQQKDKISLLDIAPAPALRNFIKSSAKVSYRSMDLYMEGVDDRVDITDMKIYKEGQFDFFICSHVLEHIPDDRKAMKELYRILKPGGSSIIMVPLNLDEKETREDPSQTDISYRWKYFGQDDHVRSYSKNDFIARLESAGFKVNQLGIDYFGKEVFAKSAILPTSVLYIGNK